MQFCKTILVLPPSVGPSSDAFSPTRFLILNEMVEREKNELTQDR
jgi:hypothetical protein